MRCGSIPFNLDLAPSKSLPPLGYHGFISLLNLYIFITFYIVIDVFVWKNLSPRPRRTFSTSRFINKGDRRDVEKTSDSMKRAMNVIFNNKILRVEEKDLTAVKFHKEFVMTKTPFVITDGCRGWFSSPFFLRFHIISDHIIVSLLYF